MKKLKLVLDTNVILSALINENSIIRDILLSDKIQLYLPEYAFEEIIDHRDTIQEKTGLADIQIVFTLTYLLKKVKIVKKEFFKEDLKNAWEIMKEIDADDKEFLALAMTLDCDGIFSQDKAFEQTKTKRWTVKETLEWIRKH